MVNNILIRDYRKADRPQILDLFKLNTPNFFSPEEEADLERYLNDEIELYFVIQYDGKVIGCGGINFPDQNSATIIWDIFHPEYQGKGLGTRLLNYRIEQLKEIGDVKSIKVRTSQLVFEFYEKNGFKVLNQVEDYWAKGFHLYEMELEK